MYTDEPLYEDEPFTDIWEQWEGEPDKWYIRFRHFLSAGPNRRISHAVQREHWATDPNPRGLTSKEATAIILKEGWYARASEWQWKERATAWDRNQATLIDELDEAERARARHARRSILAEIAEVTYESVPKLRGAKVSWASMAQMIKAYTDSSRTEYDDNPTVRSETTVTVKEIQEFTITVIDAFNEVNELNDPRERREAFAAKLEALSLPDSSATA